MLLPAFWQEKPFTTTRLPLLLSSICFYIQGFPDSTALGTDTLVQGKVHIRWIIKQNKVLLLSQSCYSVTPLALFLWKRGSDSNYGSMEISIIWVWIQGDWKQDKSCWLFFLTFKAEVYSKAPQKTQSTFLLIVLFHLSVFGTCLGAVQVAECWRCLAILEQKQEKERMFTKTSIA